MAGVRPHLMQGQAFDYMSPSLMVSCQCGAGWWDATQNCKKEQSTVCQTKRDLPAAKSVLRISYLGIGAWFGRLC